MYAHIGGCEDDEFTCGNGDCVETIFRCDKVTHCMDNSDEQSCECKPAKCMNI